MHLLFLGTGPAEAIPRKGHTDAACLDAIKGGKSRRTRSSVFLSDGDAKILIDAGPDFREQMKRAFPSVIPAQAGIHRMDSRFRGNDKAKRTDAVFLTHAHLDACGGVGSVSRSVPIYTDPITAVRLRLCHPKHTFVEFVPFKPIRIKSVEIIPFPVIHATSPDFPTHGYLFNHTLAYASDMKSLPPKSAALLRQIQTLVLDGAMYLNVQMPTHLSADASIQLAAKLRAKNLILTQIGHTYPPHAIAEKAVKKFAASSNLFDPQKIALAYDGLKIECS